MKSGSKNSSITRVRPFFQTLLSRDPSGASWLSKLTAKDEDIGKLLPWVSEKRLYADKVLKRKKYGIHTIQLYQCFEKRTPPPTVFLKWLVEHADPDHMERDALRQRESEDSGA